MPYEKIVPSKTNVQSSKSVLKAIIYSKRDNALIDMPLEEKKSPLL